MIKPLRKAHFIIWHVLALFLPCLIILSVVWRPVSEEWKFTEDMLTVEMTPLSGSTSKISLKLKKPLAVASCVVYADGTFLGMINQQGNYEFIISTSLSTEIALIDFIRNRTITSINVPLKKSKK